MLSMWFILKQVLLIALHNIFWWKVTQFHTIIDDLNEALLRLKSDRRTTKLKRKLIVIWIVATGLALLIAFYKSHSWMIHADDDVKVNSELSKTSNVLWMLVYDVIVIHVSYGWLFATAIFYAFVQSSLRDISNHMNNSYVTKLPHHEVDDAISMLQELKWIRQDLQAIQTKVNQHFGLIVFVWLLIGLVDVAWLIVNTDSVVVQYFMSTWASMFSHNAIYVVMIIGAINFATRIHREETSATYHLLEYLKANADDPRDLINEKARLLSQINSQPPIPPKVLNLVPINLHSTIFFVLLTVVVSLVARLVEHQKVDVYNN